MTMRLLAAFARLLVLFTAEPATAQSAEERAQLDWVEERGWLLYEIDRAAWVGTDDMTAQMRDPATIGVRGYIVEPEEGGYAVTFYGGPEAAPVTFYRGRVESRRVVSREIFPAEGRPPLTPLQRRLVAAREIAAQLDNQPCEGVGFNTVVVPPPDIDDPVDVYLLTPQLRAREWPLGGHYRATIGTDGTVTSGRRFATSCITLGGGELPGEQLEALFITHLLDPLPTEIHVFTMWTSQLPIGVATAGPDRVWWLSSRGIELDSNIDD